MGLHKDHVSRCTDLLGTLEYLASAFPHKHGEGMLLELSEALYPEHVVNSGMVAKLKKLLKELEQPEQRAAVSYVLADIHEKSGEPRTALAVLRQAITADKTSSANVWKFYLFLLNELEGANSAYTEGLRGVGQYVSLHALHKDLSYLAEELNRPKDADQHLESFLSHNTCSECRERVLLNHSLPCFRRAKSRM